LKNNRNPGRDDIISRLQWIKSVDLSLKPVPEKSVRIEIIIEKIEKKQTGIPEGMTLSTDCSG